jgi:hypothetical protein
VGTHSQVPLAQRLERSHMLDVVPVEMLELQPVLEKHSANEPLDGMEKPCSLNAMSETM